MTGPVLTTERLVLRRPEIADFEAVHLFHHENPRAAHIGVTHSRLDSWTRFLGLVGHWTLRGYGSFTLVHRDSGAVVGRAGVQFHETFPEPELGWAIYDGHERQGYATEAVRAVRDWFARAVSPRPLISFIDPPNHASRALAEKLGARPEGQFLYDGTIPLDVWRHPEAAA